MEASISSTTIAKGSARKNNPGPSKTWLSVELASLKALATIRFSIEDIGLYPPLCKQHIWQKVLAKVVAESSQTQETSVKIQLMHGEVCYAPMDSFTLGVDATFLGTQFNQEELMFLRKLRLEQFLCDVPW